MTEEQVFLAAVDRADPADRAAYLDTACRGDARLRRQVEDLLDAHFKPGPFLDEPLVHQLGVNPTAPAAGLPGAPGKPFGRVPVGLDAGPDGLHFLQPSARPDSLGRIAHYEVLEVVGRGAFGIVFRAFDDVLQRVVAVKAMAPALAATSPARKRFLREARASAAVRHDNVVQVHEVGEHPLPHLVMEFIPGETLQQRLDRTGPLEAADVVNLGRQIAEGLAAAHATGLIHRDVKPCNVLIENANQRVKITDFGLARAADDASLTQSGVLAGTPMFMSPEQAKGEPLDHRADLFSLGSVLYTMTAGRPPFRAATTFAVMKRVVEDAPRPIRDVIPETPPWLCDVIARLHAKEPAARFQSAREAADVLAECGARLASNARPADFPRTLPGKPAGRPAGRWIWALAAVLSFAALAWPALKLAGVAPRPREPGPTPDVVANGNETRERLKETATAPVFTNSLGMTFRPIPAGEFTMGSSRDEIDHWLGRGQPEWRTLFLKSEAPEHRVEITAPFHLGVTEVTVGQFRRYVDANPNHAVDERWQQLPFRQTDDHPVVFVDWQAVNDFCTWLSEKDGRPYRLPTEAEWEYCCRAGKSGLRYCYGDDETQLDRYAWYDKNSNFGTKPVGRKGPNDWGLFDMHGNAWEWCRDYHDLRYYESSPVRGPGGPASGTGRIKRGGAWSFGAVDARSAFRSCGGASVDCGFRVLLDLPPGGAVKRHP